MGPTSKIFFLFTLSSVHVRGFQPDPQFNSKWVSVPIKEGRQASCVFLQLGTDFVCVCLCVAQWDRAAGKCRKSAGWRTKEGYVWWDWWCWRQTVWAHDCSSPSLIFLSRFCCVRASFCGFHPAFALQCSLWCTQLLPLIFNKYECKTDQGKCLGFCFYF